MTLTVLPDAKSDIAQAMEYCPNCRSGLEAEFLEEVIREIAFIVGHPRSLPRMMLRNDSRELRRAIVHRFPYSIIDEVRSTEVVVLSVAHHSRRPNVWRKRRAPD